ncbi:helix-turn-helix domain-containing protein [Tychonema sp. LEGE 07203]|uniref:helix-turn-helix domain-containing protein n=1 Tax=Tychonema sp. LEGE 07203 TaxID=1828671 RepID=UPI00351C1723
MFIWETNPLSSKLLDSNSSPKPTSSSTSACTLPHISFAKSKKLELMNIFRISYKTLYNWFNRWELEGMIGLYNKPKIASKSLFDSLQKP